MPEPDRARLGSSRIRLEAEVVQFVPSRIEAWRGIRAVSLPYAQVAGLVMTEPKGLARGRLILKVRNGESHQMSFGFDGLPKMRQTYRELWRRIQAARDEEPQ